MSYTLRPLAEGEPSRKGRGASKGGPIERAMDRRSRAEQGFR
jgi:hypothetical protein